MTWPTARPAWLPPEVWRFAHELRDNPETMRVRTVVLIRLLAPEMAPTWHRLAACGVTDPRSWRLLLDLFATSAPGMAHDRDLRAGMAEATRLQAAIVTRAAELAALLAEAQSLANRRRLKVPVTTDYRGTVDKLEAIQAAAVADVVPASPHGRPATTRKGGTIPEWVRHFEARWRIYADQIQPAGLTLDHADLARIGSAVLGLEVDRTAVRKYRATTPDPLPPEYGYFLH